MDNSDLTIEEFAQKLNMGRTVFYQKLKSIIGLSPVDFIREIRIKRAVQLIDSGEYNFSQVAYMTGFNDPKYFSKCFKKQVGMTPSEYKEGKKMISDKHLNRRGCVKTLAQPFYTQSPDFRKPGFAITQSFFVSLGIKYFVMAKLHFRPYIPNQTVLFFLKELMKTLRRTTRFA